MIDITTLRMASEEMLDDSDPLAPPEERDSRKMNLARRLEAQGKKPILVGRAIVTIERSESDADLPAALQQRWGVLKISLYSDPDVSGHENPEVLYIAGGRFGLGSFLYDNGKVSKKLEL